ncbi:MarR family transcriptional regulator [Rhodococcoides fascians]|uniref:MarR family winged helix-turn-helix transcriptional regulator n=1 Tax=Rhodococcoides fascians TaxID=1828 RepID=UPI002ACEADDA|nr:MarR family transcriptional regulator [Rhodococcus fascians]WQH28815.1 MarR family transcriptional regulator [Rhodococcus fascians]
MSSNFDTPNVTVDDGDPDARSIELEVASAVLRLAATARSRFVEILRPSDMSWARYEVLELLCRRGPLSYRELGSNLDRHRTSIKTTVDNLVESGYLHRYPDTWMRQRFGVGSYL